MITGFPAGSPAAARPFWIGVPAPTGSRGPAIVDHERVQAKAFATAWRTAGLMVTHRETTDPRSATEAGEDASLLTLGPGRLGPAPFLRSSFETRVTGGYGFGRLPRGRLAVIAGGAGRGESRFRNSSHC